uniref:N-terminal methionine N(alpha)-acetyltransferase NatE n=1 Tax=Daphnia sinensis TaxID=1820382 RepID=A0A4Y7N745_9CRUS|nr:EOG090X0ED2 [Daphnia sinensis]
MTRATIELGDVTPHNLQQLKRLNQVVFPVSYNDKFYKDILEAGELAKLAYYNDIVVGAVCCRIDVLDGSRRLYIMTLGCLAPYRKRGIGAKMLEHVLNYVEKDGDFHSIFLHVQVNNQSAIDFYKKFGFEIVETKEQYYKRIEPADAHVLMKLLRPQNNLTNIFELLPSFFDSGLTIQKVTCVKEMEMEEYFTVCNDKFYVFDIFWFQARN